MTFSLGYHNYLKNYRQPAYILLNHSLVQPVYNAFAKSWSVEKALEYYNIPNWGVGYFGINDKGHFSVWPYGQPGPCIDLLDVIEEIQSKNLNFPCVVRFQDILRDRVTKLVGLFNQHLQEAGYAGKYFGVYPIKVNQLREVVEEILDAGAPFHFGLEAGSKGELISVLAYNTDPEALTICNGYKDDDYLRLALLGRKLERKAFVVIEKLSELPRLLDIAKEMGVEPLIGIRAKLSTQGAGRWVSSSGAYAKFGLTTPEIIQAFDLLKSSGKLHTLKLFHFHAGSQLTDIRTIKEALNEGARIYAKLCKMGADIDYFDVGGGLGVDYEGSNSISESSVNYTLDEYVSNVIYTVQEVCKDEKVKEPHLVSESGRAVTAHHSCIITSVLGTIQVGSFNNDFLTATPNETSLVKEMREVVNSLTPKNRQNIFHEASAIKDQIDSKFKFGLATLEERAKVEALYWGLCRQIAEINASQKRVPKEMAHLKKILVDQYLTNFSVFQSVPDAWAFGQLFPIVPLQRLNEAPLGRGTIVDITCDSDGKIEHFVDPISPSPHLAFHDINEGEPYYLGLFLLGAYQDIMGDMHNLFGRVNEVHVFCDDEDPEDFYLEEVIPGDNVGEILTRLQYTPSELARMVKRAVDDKIKVGSLKPKEGVTLIDFYEQVISSYTYLKTKEKINGTINGALNGSNNLPNTLSKTA